MSPFLCASRRQLPVRLPDRDRGRCVRRPVVRGDAEAGSRAQLLVRTPRLGIHRHRTLLADLPVHRPVAVAVADGTGPLAGTAPRSEEHTSELQSLMRISYAVFCLK